MPGKAHESWNLLKGVICVYKPSETSWKYVLIKLKKNISRDLNNLDPRPPRTCLIADRSGSEISINIRPSYSDNVLCAGPRYKTENIHLDIPTVLSNLSSGVFLLCINSGLILTSTLRELSFTRCYHLKGILGQASENFHELGKIIARASYDKVDRFRFENVLASFQSAHQTRVFEEYGVPLHSQEAYNFAVKGLYRPVWKGPTIIYSLKLVDFKPPNFTIEVQCAKETESYLLNLIHNLGLFLKCYATCTGIRCLRQGCFHVEHSLARNQWNLDNIIDNIKLTWDVLEKNYPRKIKYASAVNTVKRYDKIRQ